MQARGQFPCRKQPDSCAFASYNGTFQSLLNFCIHFSLEKHQFIIARSYHLAQHLDLT